LIQTVNSSGPCADRVCQIDWGQTDLGPADAWPQMLRLGLETILRSAAPKLLLWGRQMTSFYNDSFACLIGDPAAEGIGVPYPLFRPELWGIVREHVAGAWRGCERLKTELKLAAAPDGKSSSYYDIYFTPLFGEFNRPAGVLIDVHDTTIAWRSSEILRLENETLQRLFLAAPVIMAYAAGADLKIRFANQAFQKFVGFRPLDGLPIAEAIPEVVEQGFIHRLERVYESGEPWLGENMPIFLRDPGGGPDRTHYVDFAYQPVKDDAARVVGILCTGYDVTEKWRARQETEQLRHHVLHASRVNAMGSMAMTLAHELNQPLAAASNYVAAARKTLLNRAYASDEQIVEPLNEAASQIVRAGEMIRRIRSVVKAGEADRQPVSLDEAVSRVQSLIEAGGSPEIKITTAFTDQATSVMADQIQLEQVLVNLVRNAAEASRESPRKEIVVSSEQAGPSRIRVMLRDFGPGLRADQINRLIEGIHSSDAQGLGVGLSLSHTLIEANGGTLQAGNARGGGALFVLELDAADPGPGQAT
jgi:two-component system sensor kinase FixL